MLAPDLMGLGLSLVEDFISEEEQQAILDCLPPHKRDERKSDRNNIWRYGRQTAYPAHKVSNDIPPAIHKISERLFWDRRIDEIPMSITVNCYFKGQVIKPHIDAFSTGKVITVLSLLAPATMRFSKKKEKSFSVELPPRSIVQMRGTIRNHWEHEILKIEAERRYSVVFRA